VGGRLLSEGRSWDSAGRLQGRRRVDRFGSADDRGPCGRHRGLGSEVNVLFMIDAPPVETDETIAASEQEEEGEFALLANERRAVFRARVDPRTSSGPGSPVRLSVDPRRSTSSIRRPTMRSLQSPPGRRRPEVSSRHHGSVDDPFCVPRQRRAMFDYLPPFASSPPSEIRVRSRPEAVRRFYLHGRARMLSSLSFGSGRGHGEKSWSRVRLSTLSSMPPPS
jgi:hypothetical protein